MSDDLRNGIIDLNTRQFGRVIELLISFLHDFRDSEDISFDLRDGDFRIEVKGSRVLKKNTINFTISNLYEAIMQNSNKGRLIRQDAVGRNKFACNIQQIKISCFDYLYYVLFFYDVMEVFRIKSEKIKTDGKIRYSDHQHKGNTGEGQFHITDKNYDYHKGKYFIKSITYGELKERLLAKNE